MSDAHERSLLPAGDGSEQTVPITERANILSINIDVATPKDIALTLCACDKEIFNGWNNYRGLGDEDIIAKINKVADCIATIVKNPGEGCVVISGCGTSGRLAYLTARRFNKYLRSVGREECFKYIISGGNDALYSSVELAEDDANEGATILKKVTEGKTNVLFIGVTCGLSAPFVAGQLDLCLSNLDIFTPVLVGFNEVDQARKTPIKQFSKTFHRVAHDMQKAEHAGRAFVLNPVVGPEPITGSSRMKSGTATKIILEILALQATTGLKLSVPRLLRMYQNVCKSVYSHEDSLGLLIQLAFESLNRGGHLYYLGCGGHGLIGVIDASECPPTYGADFHDIRGFVDVGLDNLDSNPITKTLSIRDFETEILPDLKETDTVFICEAEMLLKLDQAVFASPAKKVFIDLQNQGEGSKASNVDVTVTLDIQPALVFSAEKTADDSTMTSQSKASSESDKQLSVQLASEVALKWTLNCVSTGAHILLGKVYKNLMVDVKVSNIKLFHRTIGIIQDTCGLDIVESRHYLLKSIYGSDNLSEQQMSAPVTDHVIAATPLKKVVPTALLMGLTSCTVLQARSLLDRQSNLSQALRDQKK